jgi:formylglycine-generating enzyme required for sulfatase activity
MTRRDILVGGIGTALGLSGCKAASRSLVPAIVKQAEKSVQNSTNNSSGGTNRTGQSDSSVQQEIDRYPALKRYVQGMRNIPAGSYRYRFYKGQSEAAPRLDVSAFRMASTPVTWAIWKEYCEAEGVSMPQEPKWGYLDNHPVVNISYDNIVGTNGGGGFCGWASRLAGFDVGLPTDVQYEYASRGGRDGYDFPWGNEFDSSYLWCSTETYHLEQTAAVDRTNRIYVDGYGLTDMIGNVIEWCTVYYNMDYRPSGINPVDNRKPFPSLDDHHQMRTTRSSAWNMDSEIHHHCRFRNGWPPNEGTDLNGFRLSAGHG